MLLGAKMAVTIASWNSAAAQNVIQILIIQLLTTFEFSASLSTFEVASLRDPVHGVTHYVMALLHGKFYAPKKLEFSNARSCLT